MAATRKPRAPKAIPAADMAATIEQLATGKAATTTIKVDLTGTSEKLVTDRIRRLPRLKGWSSLAVKRVGQVGEVIELEVTSSGQQALPWPTKGTAQPEPAKAPRKAAAKAKAPAALKAAAAAEKAAATVKARKAASAAKVKAAKAARKA